MGDQIMKTIHTGEALPFLDLPEADGGRVRVWDYRGKRNVVLFFAHGVNCSRCMELLKVLASNYKDVVAQEAEVLFVLPVTLLDAAALKHEMNLAFPVLYDETRETYGRYGVISDKGEPISAVLVSDRFGEVYHMALAHEEHELPSFSDIMSWLHFIELQCPECGAPAWPR